MILATLTQNNIIAYYAMGFVDNGSKLYKDAIVEVSDIEKSLEGARAKTSWGKITLKIERLLKDSFDLSNRKYHLKLTYLDKIIFDDLAIRVNENTTTLTLQLKSSFEIKKDLLETTKIYNGLEVFEGDEHYGEADERVKPLILGHVNFFKPLLLNKSNLEYYYNKSYNFIDKVAINGSYDNDFTDNLDGKIILNDNVTNEVYFSVLTLEFNTTTNYNEIPAVSEPIELAKSETTITIQSNLISLGSSSKVNAGFLYRFKFQDESKNWIYSPYKKVIVLSKTTTGGYSYQFTNLNKAVQYEFKSYIEDFYHSGFNNRYGSIKITTLGNTENQDIYEAIDKKEDKGVAQNLANTAEDNAKTYTTTYTYSKTEINNAINSIPKYTTENLKTDLKNANSYTLGSFTFAPSGSLTIQIDTNNGIWLSPNGITAKKNGEDTFSLTNQGALVLRGTIYADNGYFSGQLKSSSGYFGDVKIYPSEQVDGVYVSTKITATNRHTLQLTNNNINIYKCLTTDGDISARRLYLKDRLYLEDSGNIPIRLNASNGVGYLHVDGYIYQNEKQVATQEWTNNNYLSSNSERLTRVDSTSYTNYFYFKFYSQDGSYKYFTLSKATHTHDEYIKTTSQVLTTVNYYDGGSYYQLQFYTNQNTQYYFNLAKSNHNHDGVYPKYVGTYSSSNFGRYIKVQLPNGSYARFEDISEDLGY